MTKFVYVVIEADGHYGDWTSVFRQSRTRDAAETFIGGGKGFRILPIDAEFSAGYGKGRRLHRQDVQRIATQNQGS